MAHESALKFCKQFVERFKGALKLKSFCSGTFTTAANQDSLEPNNLNVTQSMTKILLFFALVLLAFSGGFAQGVTTSTISGFVTDQKGEALPGANVIADK